MNQPIKQKSKIGLSVVDRAESESRKQDLPTSDKFASGVHTRGRPPVGNPSDHVTSNPTSTIPVFGDPYSTLQVTAGPMPPPLHSSPSISMKALGKRRNRSTPSPPANISIPGCTQLGANHFAVNPGLSVNTMKHWQSLLPRDRRHQILTGYLRFEYSRVLEELQEIENAYINFEVDANRPQEEIEDRLRQLHMRAIYAMQDKAVWTEKYSSLMELGSKDTTDWVGHEEELVNMISEVLNARDSLSGKVSRYETMQLLSKLSLTPSSKSSSLASHVKWSQGKTAQHGRRIFPLPKRARRVAQPISKAFPHFRNDGKQIIPLPLGTQAHEASEFVRVAKSEKHLLDVCTFVIEPCEPSLDAAFIMERLAQLELKTGAWHRSEESSAGDADVDANDEGPQDAASDGSDHDARDSDEQKANWEMLMKQRKEVLGR